MPDRRCNYPLGAKASLKSGFHPIVLKKAAPQNVEKQSNFEYFN